MDHQFRRDMDQPRTGKGAGKRQVRKAQPKQKKPKFVNQLFIMYGVHYDQEDIDDVVAAFKTNPKFAPLDDEKKDREIVTDDFTIILTANSDRNDGGTRGAIFVDEMTIEGEDEDDAEDTFIKMEPTEMIKSENSHPKAVDMVTDIYELVVAEFKKKNLPLDTLHLGWSAVSCTWDISDDEPAPKAKPPQATNKPNATKAPASTKPKGAKHKGGKKKNKK